MNRILTLGAVVATLCANSVAAASDARSIALGGAVIANGKGVHGALANPASMMAMQRRGESTHVRFGFSAELRDTGDSIDTLTDSDNDDLISNISQEVDTLSEQPIQCNPLVDDDTAICINGTQRLSDLSAQLLDIANELDDETLEGFAATDIGAAFTRSKFPVAVNLRVSAAGVGTADIADGDLSYISEFATALDDDSLTLGEIQNASFFETQNDPGTPLVVTQPEDILESEANGGAVVRVQLGVSLATTLALGGFAVDVGITPKVSSLTARSLDINIRDEFLDNVPSAADRFDDSEVTETSFTTDIGASIQPTKAPLRVAAVVRNLIPESIETNDGFEFETTTQLILGAAFQRGRVSIMGDIAVNEAKLDGFETQKIGVGVEFGTRFLALRGGLAHDAARSEDSTALTLGFGLGPLEVGGRISSTDSLEAGAQLAFSFK